MRQVWKRPLFLVAAITTSAAVAGCGEPIDASFVVSPDGAHLTGDVITFTAKINCHRGATQRIRWDLDGDGMFEHGPTNCFEHRDIQHVYTSPGTYTVSTDMDAPSPWHLGFIVWLHGYSSQTVVVGQRPAAGPPTNQPPAGQPPANKAPVANLTHDANPGYVDRAVHFDAAPSSDADGQIVKYEWDFDSDGTWDATGVTASRVYLEARVYKVTLRVTDNNGASSTVERAVPIMDGVPPAALGGSALTAAGRGTPFSTTLNGKVASSGQSFINGGTLSQIGLTAHGDMKIKGLPKPLERKRKARWAATFATKQRGSDANAKLAVEGSLLLDFGGGDRVCFGGRVAGTLDTPFTGRLGVVGGTGKGLRLRGGASLVVPLTGKTVDGKVNLTRTKKARRLPKACRSLARTLR